jgi:hypothetical protein
MTDLNRAMLIETLARLGAESDEIVLEAARAAHRQITESGCNWDEIINPAAADTAAPAAMTAPAADGRSDIARQIDRLIRKGVSDSLRDDLVDMQRQLAAGTLDPDDARYVQALARRLGL